MLGRIKVKSPISNSAQQVWLGRLHTNHSSNLVLASFERGPAPRSLYVLLDKK